MAAAADSRVQASVTLPQMMCGGQSGTDGTAGREGGSQSGCWYGLVMSV